MKKWFIAAALVLAVASPFSALAQSDFPPQIVSVDYTVAGYDGDPDFEIDSTFSYYFDFFSFYFGFSFWSNPVVFDPFFDVATEFDLITLTMVVRDDDYLEITDPNQLDKIEFFYRIDALGTVGPPEAPALIGTTNAQYRQPWFQPSLVSENEVVMIVHLWVPKILGANASRLRNEQDWDVRWSVQIRVANGAAPGDGEWDSRTFPLAAVENTAFVPGNPPPVADAGPDQIVAVGSTVLLDGHLSFDSSNLGFDPSDPNVLQRDVLHYTWEQLSGPDSVDIQPDPSQSASSPYAFVKLDTVTPAGAPYVFRLTVDDNVNSPPSTDTVQVAVVTSLPGNRAPRAVISDSLGNVVSRRVVGVTVGGPVALSAALSSDPDGNALTYRWSQSNELGGPLATDEVSTGFQPVLGANTQAITWTAVAAGTYYFRLLVTDNPPPGLDSLSATDSVTVVVSEALAGSQDSRSDGKESATAPDAGDSTSGTDSTNSSASPTACGGGSAVPLALGPLVLWLGRGRRRS